jgi:hypothetical protein
MRIFRNARMTQQYCLFGCGEALTDYGERNLAEDYAESRRSC